MLTGSQIRAARGLLNLSAVELAERTSLAINTIRRAESSNGIAPISQANMRLLEAVFGDLGIVFIPSDTLGPGVRLKAMEPAAQMPRRRKKSSGLGEI